MAPAASGRDPYAAIGVARDASADEIKKAYRKLAQQHHPDRNEGDAEAEERFKAVSAAYAVLSDEKRRAEYDEFGEMALDPNFDGEQARQSFGGRGGSFQGFGGGDPTDFGSLFENLFGAGASRGGAPMARRGRDIEAQLHLDFKDAALGVEQRVTISRPQAAGGQKQETLTVRIPPGVDDGGRIRLAGKGGEGQNGAPSGDLYCTIGVRPHRIFTRSARNLLVDVPVSTREAIVGAEIEIPTLEGRVHLRVPPGTDGGNKLRLRGKGLPASGSKAAGDLIVTVRIKTPKKLEDEEREKLESLLPDDGDDLRRDLLS